MVFSWLLTSLLLFLCSVPGFGQTQFNRSLEHSEHLGRVSQHRFFRCRHVKQPMRDLLVTPAERGLDWVSEADFSDDRASEELRRGLPTPSFLLVSTSESQFSRKSGANAEVVELGPGYCIISPWGIFWRVGRGVDWGSGFASGLGRYMGCWGGRDSSKRRSGEL